MNTKPQILVVDDETELCANIRDILETNDCFVECAANGKEAIELTRKDSYDIAIIDIKLPDIPGIEVVREIRTISPSTEFICMTGYASIDSAMEAVKQEGIVSYEIKPLNMDHLLSIIKQITERKQVEEALKESEEKYRKLIETAKDAIVCVDERGIINVWNTSAEKIFGYSQGEILGQPLTTIIPEKYKKEHKERFTRFLETGKSKLIGKTIRLEGMTKKGDEIPIEISLSFRKIGLEQYAFTAIIRDITFQKKVEQGLIEKTKKLKSVNKELEDFVYSISHDLKEPLFAISGYISRLLKTYEKMYDDKGKHYIDRIKANLETMSNRVYDIMEVIKVGTVEYNFTHSDSVDIVKDVVNELESKINDNKIKVTIRDNLPTIKCDGKKLRSIFSNLLINAIKFMGDDVQRQVTIGCDKEGDYYKFFVEDTGIGILEEHQEQIFKIFRRLKDIEVEGTGVGLAIVKKIVELHNGKIWVESPVKDKRGTRFCFTIPISGQ